MRPPILDPQTLSPDERPFVVELLADSDSVLPWLVYADWLDEQGDPLSEIIRLRVAIEQAEEKQTLSEAERRERRQELRSLIVALPQDRFSLAVRLGLYSLKDLTDRLLESLKRHGPGVRRAFLSLTNLLRRPDRQQTIPIVPPPTASEAPRTTSSVERSER